MLTARTPAFRTPPLAGRRLLVVEDHDDSRDALRLLLESLGAQVLPVESGPRALELLARTALPDLILADIRMPGMDGLELAHALGENLRWRRIPRIAVTAGTSMAEIHATLEAGYAGHLGKPIDPDVLLVTLLRVLDEAEVADERRAARRRPPRRIRRPST
jgi:CheY-like chemotaxis protein